MKYQNYQNVFGVGERPPIEHEPWLEQLTALSRLLSRRCQVLERDLSRSLKCSSQLGALLLQLVHC